MSLLRRPFTKKAFRRFTVSFFEKEIELARGRVGIQLLVPSPLFAYAKPLDDARVVFRGQAIDSSLNLLDSAHACSLSPSLGGFIPCGCLTALGTRQTCERIPLGKPWDRQPNSGKLRRKLVSVPGLRRISAAYAVAIARRGSN